MVDRATSTPRPMRNARRAQRKPQAKRRRWQNKFLTELSRTGNVRLACEIARVERSTVYKARYEAERIRSAADPKATPNDFAAKWDEAIEEACDRMEQEAWRRGM